VLKAQERFLHRKATKDYDNRKEMKHNYEHCD
jgi:hypothetical protein